MASKTNISDPHDPEIIFAPEDVGGFTSAGGDGGIYTHYHSLAQLYEVLNVHEETEIIQRYGDAQAEAARLLGVLVYPLEAYLQVVEKVVRADKEISSSRVSEITVALASKLEEMCGQARTATGSARNRILKALGEEILLLDYRHIAAIYAMAGTALEPAKLVGMTMDEAKTVIALTKEQIDIANTQVDILFKHNIRLFMKIAHEFARHPHMRQHRDDLIQEGAMGLLSAIHKYTRGQRRHDGGDNKLSGWATLWIKHHVRRWIDKSGHSIKRPVRKSERLRKLVKALAHLSPPRDMEEVRAMKDSEIEELAKKIEGTKITAKEILELRDMPSTASMNAPASEDGGDGTEIGDLMAAERGEHGYVSEEGIDRDLKIAAINSEVGKLDIISRVALTSLYGMGAGQAACFDYGTRMQELFGRRTDRLVARLKAMGPAAPRPASIRLYNRGATVTTSARSLDPSAEAVEASG